MKVKELRAALKGLPANMEVMVNTGLPYDIYNPIYQEIAIPIRKIKKRLIKKVGSYTLIQKRPKKDPKAKLSLVIE